MNWLVKHYHHLIVLLPFLFFTVGNFHDLNIAQELTTLSAAAIVSLLVVIASYIASLIVKRNIRDSLAVYLSLSCFVFFNYGLWRLPTLPYVAILIVVPVSLTLLLRKRADVNQILAITALSMSAVCLIQIAHFHTQRSSSSSQHAWVAAKSNDMLITPNIYSIMLDAYSRLDQLTKLGHDNLYFEQSLKERGFYVATEATSNFIGTEPSMYTFWSLEYPPLERGLPLIDRAKITNVLLGKPGQNRALDHLRSLGYRHIRMGPNQSQAQDCSGYEDECLFRINAIDGSARRSGGHIHFKLIQMTPLIRLDERSFGFSRNTYLKSTVDDALKALRARARSFASPYFLDINVWQPHGPYLFDRQCKRHDAPPPYEESWNNDYPGSIDYYSQETHCVNSQLISLIDYVLKHDPEAIMVIQSDHGHGFFTDFTADLDDWTQESIAARSSILWAAKLPEACQGQLYDSVSPVNTFRIIFACLHGEETAALLRDSVYIHKGETFKLITSSSFEGAPEELD